MPEHNAPKQSTPEQSTPHNAPHSTETPIAKTSTAETSTAETSTAETSTTETSTTETLTTEQLKNNYLKIRKIYQATEKALGFSKKAGKSAEDIAHATNQLAKLHTRMQEAQTAMLCAEKAESQINDDKI